MQVKSVLHEAYKKSPLITIVCPFRFILHCFFMIHLRKFRLRNFRYTNEIALSSNRCRQVMSSSNRCRQVMSSSNRCRQVMCRQVVGVVK